MELDIKQSHNREKDIKDELERLKGKKDKTAEDRAKAPALLEEFRQVHEHRLNLEHDAILDEVRGATQSSATNEVTNEARGDAQVVDRARGTTFINGKYKNPWDTSEMRVGYGDSVASELRSRAKDAIERMEFADDKVREAATRFVERDGDDNTPVSNLVLSTTSPAYGRAFIKLVKSRGNAGVLSGDEQAAYQRAMSLTDNAGGFMVPFQLDPTVILTANGSFNQVRQIAKVVQATGDVWNGVSSAGVTGSWDGEAAEVSDDAPALAQPSIPVHKLQIFVPLSHEVQMDAPGLANEIAKMIAFEKDVKESTAFVTGSGNGQPTGIITALTGGSSVVPSAGSDALAIGDVYGIDAALPARYAFNGSWLAHRAIYNKLRQLDTAGGNALWGQLAEGRKSELLGRPDYVAEAMDGTITALADNLVMLFGDFQNYVVADRLGTSLSYIPHLFGGNGRPTGQAGWHAWIRVGGDSVNDSAFRLLNCT